MMSDYTPIDCNLHSEYELAIIQGKRLRTFWRDQDGRHGTEVLKPCDLLTRNHEEFLVVESPQGQQLEIRLDHIDKAETIQNSRT
jgi:Rho-binding antiterminator